MNLLDKLATSVVFSTALVGCNGGSHTEDRKTFEDAQADLEAIDLYIQSVDSPESFDGFYSLGWDPLSRVSDKYMGFALSYKQKKN